MKVLMLGWEFPPFISGGLGTACHGLARALGYLRTEILFVLPRPLMPRPAAFFSPGAGSTGNFSPGGQAPNVQPDETHAAETHVLPEMPNVAIRTIDSMLSPYMTQREYQVEIERRMEPAKTKTGGKGRRAQRDISHAVPAEQHPRTAGGSVLQSSGAYAGDLFLETKRYAALALAVARDQQFDLIHAHDWLTFSAAEAVADITGKPLVVHIHSTEFDRAGTHGNEKIHEIERRGMMRADRIIAVSHYTRNLLMRAYGIPHKKIAVVYNAVQAERPPDAADFKRFRRRREEKLVLFLGRLTHQKGPEYFLAAARRVLEIEKNVRFIMAGSGDRMRPTIEKAAEMGIGQRVLFTGFLNGPEVARLFRLADLYVMPSVSEPFGIAPLEAAAHSVPVIISKQSGVSEVLHNALKVDFWNVDELAAKILAVLRYPALARGLRAGAREEVARMTWLESARRLMNLYQGLLK